MKICSTCKNNKSFDNFYKKGNGHSSQCKTCLKRIYKIKYEANPEKYRNRTRLDRLKNPWRDDKNNLRKSARRSNLRFEEAKELRKNHSGLCDLCGKNSINNRRLAFDHNHITGKFRGFLYCKCNQGIGLFNDDIKLLRLTINYLLKG